MAFAMLATPAGSRASEVTVQNDSFQGAGNVQAGFAENESAAAWLTSPCQGSIVAVQVLWLSNDGTTGQSLEDSITIFNTGNFPVPNATNFTILEGPVLTDGFINEFRYLDEGGNNPINVPVNQGQVFVVSLRFANNPDPSNGPSVVTDVAPPAPGCQPGKNSINGIGFGWGDACGFPYFVSGDFVIRAVVNCPDPQGACCLTSGGCQIKTQSECNSMGGNYRGNGTTCGASTCDGACCFPDGTCTQVNQGSCTSGGGSFKGVGVACTPGLCLGACCLANGSCSDAQPPNACAAAGGVYKGDGTTCGGTPCTGACCFLNGSCQQLTLAQCNSQQNTTWNGPATNCGTFSCPVAGACCLSDGTCVNGQTQSQCTSLGGNWDGAATVCGATGVCERACCFPGGCVDLRKTDCDNSAGTWQGILYHCNGSSCPTGACCMPLGECVEATTPVSCASMGGTFNNGMTCAQANCPVPIGACCIYGSGTCVANRTPQQCTIIGGAWAGANTPCTVCCPGPAGIAADINNDGTVNGKDVQRFVAAMLGTPTTLEKCRGDFDQNGSLGVGDIPGAVNALLTAP
jgi:hypothetical protein